MERVGIGFPGDMQIPKVIEFAREAEARGFESIWIPEDYYYRDAVTRLAALALSTNTIQLATGVINPYSRSPPLIAMTVATLDEASRGRMILGLGASLRMWLYEKHLPKVNHLKAVRESVEIIRQLLAGHSITYAGNAFKLENLRLGFAGWRKQVPIYLGALGPKMIELAGEIAEGLLLGAGTTPEYVKIAKEHLTIGAERVGRDPRAIDIACFLTTSVSDSRDTARQMVKEEIAYLVTLSRMDVVLGPSGLLENKSIPRVREAGLRGEMKEAARYVDDELIDALAVTGSIKDCSEGIRRLRRAGVTQPIPIPISSEMFMQVISALTD